MIAGCCRPHVFTPVGPSDPRLATTLSPSRSDLDGEGRLGRQKEHSTHLLEACAPVASPGNECGSSHPVEKDRRFVLEMNDM